MSLEKIDRVLSVMGKGLSILTALSCIIGAGVIAFFILKGMGHEGLILWALTSLCAIVGGLIVNLILRVIIHLLAHM